MYDGIKNGQCNNKPIGAQLAFKGPAVTMLVPGVPALLYCVEIISEITIAIAATFVLIFSPRKVYLLVYELYYEIDDGHLLCDTQLAIRPLRLDFYRLSLKFYHMLPY